MKNEEVLKKFDRFLYIKKKIDGTIEIYRKSQFNKKDSYLIKELKNYYLGSMKSIIYMLSLMDSRKIDFFIKSILHNRKLQTQKTDDRIHKEIGEFLHSGADKIIT